MLQCSLSRLHLANRLSSACDPFCMGSINMTHYAGIWFTLGLLACTLPSSLGLTFRMPNLMVPRLSNYWSRLGLPCLSSVYGMHLKLTLIHGDLLSQMTGHGVIWSIRPLLPQQYTSIVFIFPYLLMVYSHPLLETVHITIWKSFCIILVRVLVLYCSVLQSVFAVLNWDFPGLVVVYRSCCNFVGRRENHTVWFSLHQFSLKLSFLVCVSFCLCPCIFFTSYLVPLAMHLLASRMLHTLCLPPCSHLAHTCLPHSYISISLLCSSIVCVGHSILSSQSYGDWTLFTLVFVVFARA